MGARFVRTCETGKRGYSSRAKARKAVRAHSGQWQAVHIYQCRMCGLWHTTSQEQRRPAA
jgi:MOSC domain-containing protein YiiM